MQIYPLVLSHLKAFEKEFGQIPEDRKTRLGELALFVEQKFKAGEKTELTFICTHNSRRSLISQIWAQTAAAYFAIPDLVSYSGGTEATAFNDRAIKALEGFGFRIFKTTKGANPIYEVRYAEQASPIKAFSKVHSDDGNPSKNFCAIMTCAHADKNCPLVPGASSRMVIAYEDPKDFDGTPEETMMYKERVHEIGREIICAFSLVKLD